MKTPIAIFLTLAVFSQSTVRAHVRQRVFRPNEGQNTGTESIVQWNTLIPLKIRMHNFSGNLGLGDTDSCAETCIDSSTARGILKSAIGQWADEIYGGLTPSLNLDLSSGYPYVSSNRCETGEDFNQDGYNNIIFTSKRKSSCSVDLSDYSGVVGLTRVQFSVSDGTIKEADMQFNDVDFLLKSSGTNDLNSNPKEINLTDVATHELGHFFGLDHSTSRTSSMVYTITENLQTTKTDDHMGIFSIYHPENAASVLGSVRGSLTYEDKSPVFGAAIFALNARTLNVSASEMTDTNGAFHFCYLPKGPHIFFAQQYKPASSNIHDYYSGLNGDLSTTQNSLGCLNPGCTIMNTRMEHSWWTQKPTTGSGGLAMKSLVIKAGEVHQYLNLTASDSLATLNDVSGSNQGSALTLDEVRLARLSTSTVPISGTTSSLGKDRYKIKAPSSGNLKIRTAALKIYSRLKIKLELFESDLSTTVTCTGNPEVDTNTEIAQATEAYLDCTGLTPSSTYYLDLSAKGLDCKSVPGNSSNCRSSGIEAATTNIPYYLVTAYAASLENSTSGNSASLSTESLQGTDYLNLPTCGANSQEVTGPAEDGGGCCGTVGPENFSGGNFHSGLLALIFNPFVWFVLLWWMRQLRFKGKFVYRAVFKSTDVL